MHQSKKERERESKWAAVDGTREKFLITKGRKKKKKNNPNHFTVIALNVPVFLLLLLFNISRHPPLPPPPLVSFISATVFIIHFLLPCIIPIENRRTDGRTADAFVYDERFRNHFTLQDFDSLEL